MIAQAFEFLQRILEFLEKGGPVLDVITLNLFVLWTLIFERLIYFQTAHRALRRDAAMTWSQRSDKSSWYAKQIREMLISNVNVKLGRTVNIIRMFVSLCPLLGLLGTVTGMITVFESMSEFGTSNAKPMADGISRAIIPTMAGMAGALTGLMGFSYVQRYVDRNSKLLYDQLRTDT